MNFSIFCPSPEVHVDTGRLEAIIRAACARLDHGMTEAEVHADLVVRGNVASDLAHLALIAAKLLVGRA